MYACNKERVFVFGKKEAQLISGCAILMMLIHHFFGFKEFLVNGNSYASLFTIGGIEIERILAAFGKLCVAIFAFCSGYAIWAVSSQYTSWLRIFKRIGKFLQDCWIICILFIVFGLCLGLRVPSIKNCELNLIGLGTGFFSLLPVAVSSLFIKVVFQCESIEHN